MLESYEQLHYFRTPEDFNSYLTTLKVPNWFNTVIVHHTAVPTVSQWRGQSTVDGMLSFYKNTKGWNRFPHLFVAPDGIWTMNKLTETGIHANAANPYSIGVEVVGDYDKIVWQEPIYSYAMETIAYLVRWGHINIDANIKPHREFNRTKSCPGKAIDMNWVKAGVKNVLADNNATRWEVVADAVNVRQGPNIHYPVAGKVSKGFQFESTALKLDEAGIYVTGVNGRTNTWAHLTTGSLNGQPLNGLGFIQTSNLKRLQ